MSTIVYRTYEGPLSEEVIHWLAGLSQVLFGGGDADQLQQALKGKQKILACLAFAGDEPIGFKVGYQERLHYFESWQGGVVEQQRSRGVASELMRIQHAWCAAQGFRILTTITDNKNVAMLTLNMRHGFVIVGTFIDRKKHVKLILQKHLSEDD